MAASAWWLLMPRVVLLWLLLGWRVVQGGEAPPPAGPSVKPEGPVAPERQPEPEKPAVSHRSWRLQLQPSKLQRAWSGRAVGVVAFQHGGLASRDGADVVVSDSTGVLPHRVLQAGPGTFLRIAFAYKDARRVVIDFGREGGAKDANGGDRNGERAFVPAASAWMPPAGLLLATYPLPSGAVAGSWAQMQKTLAGAQKLGMLGCDFVPNVYHGYHPFASIDKFVSLYEGWLGCPADGEYVFATSSDDASFLRIDGKLVVAWPGAHGAVWDARFNKRIRLRKGVHRLQYVHVNFGGPTITCAAWKPPGAKKIWPIGRQSFAPVTRFTPTRVWRRDVDGKMVESWRGLLAVENLGEAWVGGHQLLRYRFSAHTDDSVPAPAGAAPRIDFGDNIRGGLGTEHIYLTPGLRHIGVEQAHVPTRGGYDVLIQPDYSRQISRQVDKPGPYSQAIAAYPFDRLPVDDLRVAIEVLAVDEKQNEALIRACEAMLSRAGLGPKTHYDTAMLLGERLRDQGKQPQRAIEVYRKAIDRDGMGRYRKARLIREVGDTFFYFLRDNDAALNEYDKVVGRYADVLEANIVRITKIKIGDIFRQKGDGAKARLLYEESNQLLGYKRTFAQNTVRKGALYKAVDDYLKRKETDAARKWLEILEWEYPLEKLDGYSSIARARIAEAEGNLAEARKQLNWFVKANPKCSYAAEALYHMVRLQQEQGQIEDAQRTAAALARAYADSPYAEKAKALLRAEKK